MRALIAFALFVCLDGTCRADAWFNSNHTGSEAFQQGKWEDALAAFQTAWPLASSPQQQAITANDLGAVLHTLGRAPEALPWYQRAVALWDTQAGHAEELSESALGLADTFRSNGDYASAENTLKALIPHAGVSNDRMAALLNALGDLFREQSRKQEARVRFQATLALDALTPTRLIDANLGLADIDRETGNRTAAREEAQQAIAIARATADKAGEALGLRVMGRTWADTGDFAKAEPLLRRSLAIFQQQAITPTLQIAAALGCLAALYRNQSKYSVAEELWVQALQLESKYSGKNHPQAAMIMESLAVVYTLQKRFAEASEMASKSWTIMSASFGPESLAAAGALATVAYVAQGEKRFEAAASSYAKALNTFREKGEPGDRCIVETKDRYAAVLAALHRNNEAKQLRQEIQAFR